MHPRWANPANAGLAYFAAVFAVGFVFGTVRVLFVEQLAGRLLSVALEIPVMLVISFLVARYLVRRFGVADDASARLAMGGLAVLLLIAAEFLLGLALGQTPAGMLANYATPRGLLTLLGQAGFALMPLLIPARAPRAEA